MISFRLRQQEFEWEMRLAYPRRRMIKALRYALSVLRFFQLQARVVVNRDILFPCKFMDPPENDGQQEFEWEMRLAYPRRRMIKALRYALSLGKKLF